MEVVSTTSPRKKQTIKKNNIMKKNIFTFALIAVSALILSASCSKMDVPSEDELFQKEEQVYDYKTYDLGLRFQAEGFDTAEIAAGLGVSRSTLDRLFAAEIGHSAGAEVKRMRITKAKRLLRTTDMKLDAVAAQCGLCHASYLIRTFRSVTGVTPHAFRAARRD